MLPGELLCVGDGLRLLWFGLLPLLLLLLRSAVRSVVRVTTERVVLFICVENAGRSLMAEAMFNADPPPGWIATSAGTSPAAAANPRTGPMLAERNLLLPDHPPRLLTKDMMDAASLRVTMGCLDDASCPAHLKGLELRDWALADPARLDDAGFRQVRDALARKVRALRTELILLDRTRAANRRSAAR